MSTESMWGQHSFSNERYTTVRIRGIIVTIGSGPTVFGEIEKGVDFQGTRVIRIPCRQHFEYNEV